MNLFEKMILIVFLPNLRTLSICFKKYKSCSTNLLVCPNQEPAKSFQLDNFSTIENSLLECSTKCHTTIECSGFGLIIPQQLCLAYDNTQLTFSFNISCSFYLKTNGSNQPACDNSAELTSNSGSSLSQLSTITSLPSMFPATLTTTIIARTTTPTIEYVTSVTTTISRTLSPTAEYITSETGKVTSWLLLTTVYPTSETTTTFGAATSSAATYVMSSTTTETIFISTPRMGLVSFQRRISADYSFDKNYTMYESGFGNDVEYWKGLKWLFTMTSTYACGLRIDMTTHTDIDYYAEYSTFYVGPSTDGYRLFISGYSGTAGDMLSSHNYCRFSTKERDQDNSTASNCASLAQSGWWFAACFKSNLNGVYMPGDYSGTLGIKWNSLTTRSHKKSEMFLKC